MFLPWKTNNESVIFYYSSLWKDTFSQIRSLAWDPCGGTLSPLNTKASESNRPGSRPTEQCGAGCYLCEPQFPHLWDGDDNAYHSRRHWYPVHLWKRRVQGPISAVCFWELQSVLGGEEKRTCSQEVFLCRHFCLTVWNYFRRKELINLWDASRLVWIFDFKEVDIFIPNFVLSVFQRVFQIM